MTDFPSSGNNNCDIARVVVLFDYDLQCKINIYHLG